MSKMTKYMSKTSRDAIFSEKKALRECKHITQGWGGGGYWGIGGKMNKLINYIYIYVCILVYFVLSLSLSLYIYIHMYELCCSSTFDSIIMGEVPSPELVSDVPAQFTRSVVYSHGF